MYIPIGPTKKQLYKIIIALILLCYLIFLGMYNPKALEYYTAKPNTTTCSNAWQCRFQFNNILDNRGDMEMVGQLYYKSTGVDTSTWLPMEFKVITYDDTKYACDIGNTYAYEDSNVDTYVMTFKCKLKTTQGNGVKFIHFITQINSDYVFDIDYVTFIWGFDNNNNSTAINNIQNNTNNINNNLNDSSIDSSSATDFTSNSAFQDSNGLDAIIKAPLNFIQSLTSSTCSSISLTIPYIDANVSLPCMSTIYNKALGQQLVNLIALVINGVVLYRYCLKILQIVKDAKNPNKDGLEVLDL